MIQIEEASAKFTRIYHTIDDIKHFSLRVRLVDETSPDEEDITTFKWQQKRFAHHERERLLHEENCHTELDKEYHQQLQKEAQRRRDAPTLIFSYVAKDNHIPEERRRSRKNPQKPDGEDNQLAAGMKKLIVSQTSNPPDDDDENENKRNAFDFFEHLQMSMKTPIAHDVASGEEMLFESFYVMADFGEYYNSTWLPAEHVLCVVQYNHKHKLLKMSPDFTMFGCYKLKVTSDETKTYTYRLENASLDGVPHQKGEFKLNSSHLIKANTADGSDAFKYVHVVLEILSGWDFEHEHVFVRYSLVLNDWRLKQDKNNRAVGDALTGVTIASKSSGKRLHFGLPVEWHLIAAPGAGAMQSDPIVHFELISKNTWSRFRTEGMTQLPLPMSAASRRIFQLACCRVTSTSVANELRRFFIGDCANHHELLQPAVPGMNRLATTTIGSGTLEVSVSVLHVLGVHAEAASVEYLREMRMREKLRDPQLARTVEEAMLAFNRAREAMVNARDAATTPTTATQ